MHVNRRRQRRPRSGTLSGLHASVDGLGDSWIPRLTLGRKASVNDAIRSSPAPGFVSNTPYAPLDRSTIITSATPRLDIFALVVHRQNKKLCSANRLARELQDRNIPPKFAFFKNYKELSHKITLLHIGLCIAALSFVLTPATLINYAALKGHSGAD